MSRGAADGPMVAVEDRGVIQGAFMLKLGRRFTCALVAAAAFAAPVAGAYAQTTLKVALHSDLKIVDPVWTTALSRDSSSAGSAS